VFQPDNAVPIGTFIDSMDDRELMDILPVLLAVEAVDDVRQARPTPNPASAGRAGASPLRAGLYIWRSAKVDVGLPACADGRAQRESGPGHAGRLHERLPQ
jgi:hypothetical protein